MAEATVEGYYKVHIVLCMSALGVGLSKKAELISHEANVSMMADFITSNYELGDASRATQDGVLKQVSAEHSGEAIQVKFAFVADDGQEYAISYVADENGYQPVGAHLSIAPPVPATVLKTLKYLTEHPYQPGPGQNY